jgi:signal transduction histidine kinase
MNNLVKKVLSFQILFLLSMVLLSIGMIIFNISTIYSLLILLACITIHIFVMQNILKKYEDNTEKIRFKQEQQFENSIKTIYDEHIFSITHELRSPLAVIYATIKNQYNTVKGIYNSLEQNIQDEHRSQFKEIKTNLEHIRHQSEIIEKFIASVSEHASYINETGDKKYIDLHKYLQSVIINSRSYSRNMKIFQDRVAFGDIVGSDYINAHTQVNPHDLSRMIINIMTNSADAVTAKYKKSQDNYEPNLKIRCIRSHDEDKVLVLNNKFMRINTEYALGFPFYILIEDNGTGISDENRNKIFQYGFSTKSNKDSSGVSKHHGLGLYLTITLANKNGIGLFVKSDENGTIFALGLPSIHYGSISDSNSDEQSNCKKTSEFYISQKTCSEDSKTLFKLYVEPNSISNMYKIIKNPQI